MITNTDNTIPTMVDNTFLKKDFIVIFFELIKIINFREASYTFLLYLRTLKINMNIVFLQLGSNLGNRESLLQDAITEIENRVGRVIEKSKVYESTPWRVEGQENYLNQILKVKTELLADDVLVTILDVEKELGRVRLEKWGERLIDIDIIFYNDAIIETPQLCVPHKHMHERMFVLTPLHDIAPDVVHPKYNKTVVELLEQCRDTELVKEYAL
jgi:2-amino-4-hydroxy-6-hydroxymethyldihydropteridine diphosphokinase